MSFMYKKLIGLVMAGIFVTVLALTTKVGSYLGVAYDRLSTQAQKAIPAEIEIERLRREIARLDRDIDQARSELAEENVACQELASEVMERRAALERLESKILSTATALKAKNVPTQVNGKAPAAVEATSELKTDVARFNTQQSELRSLERQLVLHEKSRKAAEKKLEALRQQQKELTITLKEIENDLKELRLEQVQSVTASDDSRLSDIKESTKALKKRIAIEREKLRVKNATNDEATPETVDEILTRMKKPAAANAD